MKDKEEKVDIAAFSFQFSLQLSIHRSFRLKARIKYRHSAFSLSKSTNLIIKRTFTSIPTDIYELQHWIYIATVLSIYSHRAKYIQPPWYIYAHQTVRYRPPKILSLYRAQTSPTPRAYWTPPHSSEALIPRDRASKPWRQSLWTVGAEPVFFLNITFFFRRNRKAESKTR